MTKDTKYLLLLALLYFAVSWIGILHHEFFIDEAHHWLLARDSNSVSELIRNTRSEGHPLLWTLLLYAITRFTSNPFWMQFIHILISTITVVVFLKKAPFNWLFKALFIFGYFMIFEYNLISRNYNLGVLFLFLACSVFKNREQKFGLLCLYLTLATNSHLLFSVIAFALFLTLLVEKTQKRNLFNKKFLSGYLIFGLGLLFIYIQIHSTDSAWLLEPINTLPFRERIVCGFGSFFKGLITIPDFRSIHFWNSNLIVNGNRPIAGVLALLTYFIPLLLFFKNRKTLFFVYTALIGAQIFFFVTQRTAIRFHGMTYILIIVALWIEKHYTSEDYKFRDFLSAWKLTLLKKPILYCIVSIQLCAGIYAYIMDYNYAFSSAKETVNYIEKEHPNKIEIVTVTCDGTLLSAYLEKKVYFLCDQSLQSFCHWNSSCSANVNQEKSVEMLTGYMNSHHKDVLFVSYYPLTDDTGTKAWINLNDKIKGRFLKKYNQNIVEKTNYFVYEVSKIQAR